MPPSNIKSYQDFLKKELNSLKGTFAEKMKVISKKWKALKKVGNKQPINRLSNKNAIHIVIDQRKTTRPQQKKDKIPVPLVPKAPPSQPQPQIVVPPANNNAEVPFLRNQIFLNEKERENERKALRQEISHLKEEKEKAIANLASQNPVDKDAIKIVEKIVDDKVASDEKRLDEITRSSSETIVELPFEEMKSLPPLFPRLLPLLPSAPLTEKKEKEKKKVLILPPLDPSGAVVKDVELLPRIETPTPFGPPKVNKKLAEIEASLKRSKQMVEDLKASAKKDIADAKEREVNLIKSRQNLLHREYNRMAGLIDSDLYDELLQSDPEGLVTVIPSSPPPYDESGEDNDDAPIGLGRRRPKKMAKKSKKLFSKC